MQPNQPVQPVVGDHLAWPSRKTQQFTPYGVSLQVGDLLTQLWTTWKSDAWRLIGITALPYGFMAVAMVGLVVAGVMMGFDPDHLDESGPLLGLVIGGGGGFLISSWLLMVAAMAGTWLVVEEKLRGEDKGAGVIGSLLNGLHGLGRLTGAYFLMGVLMTALMAPALAALGGAVALESWALGGVAMLLMLPTFLAVMFVSLRLMPLGPVLVAEDVGVIDAFKRSLELTRGNFGDIFVAAIAFFGVMMAVNMGVTVIGLIPLVGVVVQLAFGIVMGSIQAVFMFMLYAGLRDRQG